MRSIAPARSGVLTLLALAVLLAAGPLTASSAARAEGPSEAPPPLESLPGPEEAADADDSATPDPPSDQSNPADDEPDPPGEESTAGAAEEHTATTAERTPAPTQEREATTAEGMATAATPVAPTSVELLVDKRNDADGDGIFSDEEEVPGAGAAVDFQVVVTNASSVPLTITTVTDTMGDATLDLLDPERCPQLATTLERGDSADCTFTLDRYLRTHDAPPREGLTNTVRVVATHDGGEVVAEDTSTVINPNARKISVEVEKANDADGDGDYSRDETADSPGQHVPFEVVVHNTSPGTAAIATLTDTWPGLDEPVDLLEHCPALDGMRLRGGGDHDEEDEGGHDGERVSSARCTFTLPDYAPAASTAVTNTVAVTIVKLHEPDRRATATATSTVTTSSAPPADGPAPEDAEEPEAPGDAADPSTPDPSSGAVDAPASSEPTNEDILATTDRSAGAPMEHDAGRLPVTGTHLVKLLLAALATLGAGGTLVGPATRHGVEQ